MVPFKLSLREQCLETRVERFVEGGPTSNCSAQIAVPRLNEGTNLRHSCGDAFAQAQTKQYRFRQFTAGQLDPDVVTAYWLNIVNLNLNLM